MSTTLPQRIDGWKAIGRYVGRDRSTAIRWAGTRGLPVHRVPGGKQSTVYALAHEIDAWLSSAGGLDDVNDTAAADLAPLSRRAVIAGAVVAGLAVAGIWSAARRRTDLPPEAQALMDQGRLLLHQNERDTQNQAIGLYRQAASRAPSSAETWGMLGVAYSFCSYSRDRTESARFRQLAERAGRRALELDPGNGLGELAMATALPLLGHWLEREKGLKRALSDLPDDPDILLVWARHLLFVGRSAEAAAACARIDPKFRSPIVYNSWLRALWSADRPDEVQARLTEASALYPNHRNLWFNRLEVMMFSGRIEEAVALALDDRRKPSGVGEGERSAILAQLDALQGDPALRQSFIDGQMHAARENGRKAINAMRLTAMFGRLDDAFAIADAFYFARGFTVPDARGNGLFWPPDQRQTNPLFEPPLAAMRADPRFARLTGGLGLERYWRMTGTMPDYRRN